MSLRLSRRKRCPFLGGNGQHLVDVTSTRSYEKWMMGKITRRCAEVLGEPHRNIKWKALPAGKRPSQGPDMPIRCEGPRHHLRGQQGWRLHHEEDGLYMKWRASGTGPNKKPRLDGLGSSVTRWLVRTNRGPRYGNVDLDR